MRLLSIILLPLLLAACAQSAKAMRELGAIDELTISKPYEDVSNCVPMAVMEEHNASLIVHEDKKNQRTFVKERIDGGGWFLEVTPKGKNASHVATYASQNMILFSRQSATIMEIIKKSCAK